MNFIMLLLGFLIGQGAVFGAQSWLISTDRLVLLAEFGLHFSFFVLAMTLVDMGSTVTLPLDMSSHDTRSGPKLSQLVMRKCALGLGCAMVLVATALLYSAFFASAFGGSFAVAASLGLLVWAFNIGGVLDGLHCSGVSGGSMSLPYLFSAIALCFVGPLPLETAGLVLGLAFSGGCLAAVVLQYVVAHRLGAQLAFTRPAWTPLAGELQRSGWVIASWLPGQLFFRFQVVICSLVLDAATTAYFIYARQIINAVCLIFVFAARTAFPGLVQFLRGRADAKLRDVLVRFRTLILGAAVITLLMAAGFGLYANLLPARFVQPGAAVALLSPIVLTIYIAHLSSQALLAAHFSLQAGLMAMGSTLFGAALVLALTPRFSLAGLLVAELGSHVVGVGIAAYVFKTAWRR